MAVDDAHVFPGFLTPVLTRLFYPKLPTTFSLSASAEVKAKIRQKEKSPKLGIRLATTKL